jgi:hypothetical protein
MMRGNRLCAWGIDRTDTTLCTALGFFISCVEPSGSAPIEQCFSMFLNRRAAARYRALASIVTGPRLIYIYKEITVPRSHKS